MPYDVFITILLTAITVVLAAIAALLALLGVGLGALALWGYAGIKDEAQKAAGKAMDTRLKEYPSVAEVVEYVQRIKDSAAFAEQMQNQIVISAAPKPVETPSKPSVQEGVQKNAPPAVAQTPEQKIATYPGEEASNARQDGNPANPSGSDSGSDPSQV